VISKDDPEGLWAGVYLEGGGEGWSVTLRQSGGEVQSHHHNPPSLMLFGGVGLPQSSQAVAMRP